MTESGKHILIVDDEALIASLYQEFLKDYGFDSATCGDGVSALKTFEQEHLSISSNLNHLFHLSKERALSSVRPIILFVEHNAGKVTALRLDNINDIITFDKSVFCSDDSTDGIMKDKDQDFMIEGFLRDGDDAPLMLINCQPLATQATEKVA